MLCKGLSHLRMQSELLPSAWPVEEPSKDQSGKSLGFMLVMGSGMTFVLERISLKTAPCGAATAGHHWNTLFSPASRPEVAASTLMYCVHP